MRLRQSIASSEGFTLVELLVVLIVIGALMAIGVPSYLNERARAEARAVQSELRATMSYAHAYFSDQNTYSGMTPAALRAIDTSVPPNVTVASVSSAGYCLTETEGGQTWSLGGPDGTFHKSDDCTGAAVKTGGG